PPQDGPGRRDGARRQVPRHRRLADLHPGTLDARRPDPGRLMAYSDLTETEQHYWDEYGTLRAITDWDGFTAAQNNRKLAARDWLVNQRKEIWRCAEGKKNCSGGAGWDVNNRAARYETLKDESLSTATA